MRRAEPEPPAVAAAPHVHLSVVRDNARVRGAAGHGADADVVADLHRNGCRLGGGRREGIAEKKRE